MTPIELTYKDLKQKLQQKIEIGSGPSISSLPNLLSAINGFLKEKGIEETTPIGSTLRASYYKNLKTHVEALKSEGRSGAYISNRKCLLAQWRNVVIEHDRYCAITLQHATPFQRAILDIFEAGASKAALCKKTGVPKATLARWCEGKTPNRKSLHYVGRIETFLGMSPGALTSLLPIKVHPNTEVAEAVAIEYRVRLKTLNKDRYAVTEPTDDFRREWTEFLQYKVSELELDEDESIKRSRGGRWRSTSSTTFKPRPSTWAVWHKKRRVPTASIAWSHVGQFLGWLSLPETRGGKGLSPESAQTLGHFSNRQYVRDFVEWKRERSCGKAHDGLTSFLRFASSLCNPRTGYLTQRWKAFGGPTDMPREAWQARCSKTFESIARLKSELADDAAPSRDSQEPIRQILALPNPLDAIAEMIVRLGATCPSTGGKREAVWARDCLLVKLSASNPLRVKNLRELTYKSDNTGHLRKSSNGEWSIFVPRQELKNQNGAAKDRDYLMLVRPEVWADLERYLSQYRPMLLKSPSDVLLLSERTGGPFSEDSLGQRFYTLTKRFLHGCPGVGPHAMRHIVATAILKANPNDWSTAAWALHDEEETVRQHYAHLAQHDAARWMGKAMDGPFGRM